MSGNKRPQRGQEESAVGTATPARTPRRSGLGTAGGAAHESPAEHSPCTSIRTGWLPLLTPLPFSNSIASAEKKASIYKHLYRKSLKHIHFIMTSVLQTSISHPAWLILSWILYTELAAVYLPFPFKIIGVFPSSEITCLLCSNPLR